MVGLGIIIFIGSVIYELFGDKGILITMFVFGFLAMAIGF